MADRCRGRTFTVELSCCRVNIWGLRRPSSFVDKIEYSVRDGANVIVRFPVRMPSGLETELRGRLHSLFYWTSVDASCVDRDPVSFLREEICPDVSSLRASSMAELAESSSFQGRLVWIEHIGSQNWSRWSVALMEYAEACRNVDLMCRTVFIVVLCGEAVTSESPEAVALVYQDFRDFVDPLDIFVLALWNAPRSIRSRERRSLLAHTVSQIAQWDCFLAEQLLSLPIEQALSPDDTLRHYAKIRGWSAATPRVWEVGAVDGTLEDPIVHSALLLIGGESKLVGQRIWAAQAAVLLPLVEERRVGLIPRCLRYVSGSSEVGEGLQLKDPYDLEVGDLARYVSSTGAPRWLKDRVHSLRRVRNKLAHMEPLEPDQALDPALVPEQ